MQPPIFEFLPADVHSLILSHVPDVPTLLALVQACQQSHQVYHIFQRVILESVVKSQTPYYILSAMLCVKGFHSTTTKGLTPIFILGPAMMMSLYWQLGRCVAKMIQSAAIQLPCGSRKSHVQNIEHSSAPLRKHSVLLSGAISVSIDF